MDYKKQFGVSENETREEIDYAEVNRLAVEIAETARQASTAIQEMEAEESEEKKNEMAAKVQELVVRGVQLSNRQSILINRLGG